MTHSCACVAHGPRFAHTATQNMRQRQAKKKNQRERAHHGCVWCVCPDGGSNERRCESLHCKAYNGNTGFETMDEINRRRFLSFVAFAISCSYFGLWFYSSTLRNSCMDIWSVYVLSRWFDECYDGLICDGTGHKYKSCHKLSDLICLVWLRVDMFIYYQRCGCWAEGGWTSEMNEWVCWTYLIGSQTGRHPRVFL